MSGPAGATQPVAPDPGLGASQAMQAAVAVMPSSPAQQAVSPAAAPGPASDPATWAPTSPSARACPWCSSILPDGESDRCPACGANLVYGSAQQLPGVTEVAPSIARSRAADLPRRGSRLMSWISGEVDDEPAPAAADEVPSEALSLPSRDVRREMLRLQLTAEGMVVSESGDIEIGPGLQADRAAQADLAIAQAEQAAAQAAGAPEQAAGAPDQAAEAPGSAAPGSPAADAAAAESPTTIAVAASTDDEILKAS